jgi:hypothetical protein
LSKLGRSLDRSGKALRDNKFKRDRAKQALSSGKEITVVTLSSREKKIGGEGIRMVATGMKGLRRKITGRKKKLTSNRFKTWYIIPRQ